MSEKVTFTVLREMQGDRDYKPGDTRPLTRAEAKHLVDLGVLREATAEEIAAAAAKADAPVADKVEEPAAAKVEEQPAAKVEPTAKAKVQKPAKTKG